MKIRAELHFFSRALYCVRHSKYSSRISDFSTEELSYTVITQPDDVVRKRFYCRCSCKAGKRQKKKINYSKSNTEFEMKSTPQAPDKSNHITKKKSLQVLVPSSFKKNDFFFKFVRQNFFLTICVLEMLALRW